MILAIESSPLESFFDALAMVVRFDVILAWLRGVTVSTYPLTGRSVERLRAEWTAEILLQGQVQGLLVARPVVLGFESISTECTLIDPVLFVFLVVGRFPEDGTGHLAAAPSFFSAVEAAAKRTVGTQ